MSFLTPAIRRRPIPDSYVVLGGAVAAGAYPGSPRSTSMNEVTAKLASFLNAGITTFVDLTGPSDGLEPYEKQLRDLAETGEMAITHHRFHIPDMGICEVGQMNRILDAIDASVAAGQGVYVHCWGGVGRTGMVIGCWMVRHGHDGDAALAEVAALFRSMSPAKWERHKRWGSPQTEPQREVVRTWATFDERLLESAEETQWADLDFQAAIADIKALLEPTLLLETGGISESKWELIRPRPDLDPSVRDRTRGALIGLAVGDAVGTTVEFKRPGSFTLVTDLTGGGPFSLRAGDWTDDTSMALCLAESLIERRRFDAHDQMTRNVRWWRDGHLSSNGSCFDIGTTVARALRTFESTGNPFSGPTDPLSAGNGSIMRLAPIPLFFMGRGDDAIAIAGESSRTTHGTVVAIDACRYLAALILGAVRGAPKDELLSPQYAPTPGYWEANPLHPVIASIASGSFKQKSPPAIRGTGYAADSLEAALWAFHHATDFRHGCLLAVNLGDDADTTAAVYGQIAGAFFGEASIPAEWRARLTHKSLIDRYAELLFQLGYGGPPELGAAGAEARRDADHLLAEADNDAVRALRQLDENIETAKREMGIMAFHTGGSVHSQALIEETRLALRVALGLSTI